MNILNRRGSGGRIMQKNMTRKFAACALCTAVICVLAPVSIPVGVIPVSLATFAILFSALLLGPKWGTVSTAVYLMIGMIGIPVFAGYTAGVAKLAGPTGGYLIGYIPMAAISGKVYFTYGKTRKSVRKKILALLAAASIGTIVLYMLGTIWFCFESGSSFSAALGVCVIPFLPGDAIKTAAAAVIIPSIETALSKSGILTLSFQ